MKLFGTVSGTISGEIWISERLYDEIMDGLINVGIYGSWEILLTPNPEEVEFREI